VLHIKINMPINKEHAANKINNMYNNNFDYILEKLQLCLLFVTMYMFIYETI